MLKGNAAVVASGAAVACCLAAASRVAAAGAPASSPPVEIGTVGWLTSFRAAKAESERTGKPVFLQFTEIPG